MKRTSAVLVFLHALLFAVPARAQVAFGTYVSVGDSLAAGYSSNSLVVTHQNDSVPALLARQAGVPDFQQPLVSEPGIPVELTLVSLVPAVIAPKATTAGAPTNAGLGRSYNNLAVPGSTAVDALTRPSDGGGFHDLILRGRGTQVAQAVALRPGVITLWTGNNDVLGAAIRGRAIDGVTLTPTAVFRQTYQGIVTSLRTTGARIFAANLPDVTSIPYVTTIPPVVTNPATGQPVSVNGQPVPLLGPSGPLPSGSRVTLAASTFLAQGIGIPSQLGGRGTPLPDEVILDPAELASIQDYVNANNRAISEICQAASIPVLDMNALLRQAAAEGINIGGVVVTSRFLSGGVFSYDGVHPNALGYAYVANEWIKLINANGGSVPELDLAPFLGLGAASASMRRSPGLPEFSWEAYQDLLAVFPRVDGR